MVEVCICLLESHLQKLFESYTISTSVKNLRKSDLYHLDISLTPVEGLSMCCELEEQSER